MKNIFLTISFSLFFLAFAKAQTSVTYINDSVSVLQNPERGFCEFTITYASNYSFLNAAFLNGLRSAKNHTIIFRYFNLDTFLNGPISTTFLANMQTDFNALRDAGFKVVVRFAYTNVYTPTPPYLDAPVKPILLNHIAQLKPYLLANADVILTLQNGFWGIWGENFYTDYYGYDGNNSTTVANWMDRKEILDSLLTCMPSDRKLSVRTPVKKAYYFNQTMPQDSITIAQANTAANVARVGGHNDCFLADYNDYTFDDTTTEKPFWSAESKYTIMGGETCNDNVPYTNCTNAKKELQRFHWTYCNDLYHPDVINRWKTNNCFAEIENKLGYRLQLVQATLDNVGAPGGVFNYNLQLYNDGYAAPVNGKLVKIIARHLNGTDSFEINIPAEVRNWFSNSPINLSGSIAVPNTAVAGTYNLFLELKDNAPSLANDVRYNIQLANTGIWNVANGENNLQQTLTIINSPLGISNIDLQIQCNAAESVLSWKTEIAVDVKDFTIEKSVDNVTYEVHKIIAYNAAQNNWTCNLPLQTSAVFYRVTANKFSGAGFVSNAARCIGFTNASIFVNSIGKQINVTMPYAMETKLQIFNINGTLVHEQKISGNEMINGNNFTSGMYIVKLQNANQFITQKINLQ